MEGDDELCESWEKEGDTLVIRPMRIELGMGACKVLFQRVLEMRGE